MGWDGDADEMIDGAAVADEKIMRYGDDLHIFFV